MKNSIKQKLHTIKKLLLGIKNVPIQIDSCWTYFLFRIRWTLKNADDEMVRPNHEFYKKQFVAHGRYKIAGTPNNSLCLFKELFESGYRIVECDIMFTNDEVPVLCHDDSLKDWAKDNNGISIDKRISQLSLKSLLQYNFATDNVSFVRATLFEDLLVLARKYDACVEIDLNKLYLGRKKCRILYEMVKRTNMLDNVIWEIYPYDFYSFAILNQKLIYQLDNFWSKQRVHEALKKQKLSSLIILSQWFPSNKATVNKGLVGFCHSKGFVMKCATINDDKEASFLFSKGIDLITTDCLHNKINIR